MSEATTLQDFWNISEAEGKRVVGGTPHWFICLGEAYLIYSYTSLATSSHMPKPDVSGVGSVDLEGT